MTGGGRGHHFHCTEQGQTQEKGRRTEKGELVGSPPSSPHTHLPHKGMAAGKTNKKQQAGRLGAGTCPPLPHRLLSLKICLPPAHTHKKRGQKEKQWQQNKNFGQEQKGFEKEGEEGGGGGGMVCSGKERGRRRKQGETEKPCSVREEADIRGSPNLPPSPSFSIPPPSLPAFNPSPMLTQLAVFI